MSRNTAEIIALQGVRNERFPFQAHSANYFQNQLIESWSAL